MDNAFIGLGIFLVTISVGLICGLVVLSKTVNVMLDEEPRKKQKKIKEHV